MKIALIIILINELLLFLGFLFVILVAHILSVKITRPHCLSRSEHIEKMNKCGFIYDESNYERREIEFVLSDGYIIHGDISMNPKGTNKFCILLHGHGTTREGAVRYGEPFFNMGYNLVFYDERGHGDNVRTDITMGYKESMDLAEIIAKLKSMYGDIEIILHGVSMGAVTALMSTKYTKDIKYIVSDSAYLSLKSIMGELINKYVKGAYFYVPYIDMFLKNKHHFELSDVEAYKTVEEINIPILYIHGARDVLVKAKNCDVLFEHTASSLKEKHIFASSGHGNSIIYEKEKYLKIIYDFDKRVNEINQ